MALDLDPASAGKPGAPRYAGFWVRFLAVALDGLIYLMLQIVVLYAVQGGDTHLAQGVGVAVEANPLFFQVGALLSPVLVIGCWMAAGATPGAMILGLRIIDSRTGGHPTPWQFVGRYVLRLVGAACAGLGILWIAIDARKQAWHDKVVGTVVIHTRG